MRERRRKTWILLLCAAVLLLLVAFLAKPWKGSSPRPVGPIPAADAHAGSPAVGTGTAAADVPGPAPETAGSESGADVSTQATGVLAGYVRDPAGAPVAGAYISAEYRHHARPDDGRYRIEGLDAGEIEVQAGAPGFPTVRAPATIRAGETTWLDLTLTRGGQELAGVVVNSAGRPVAGARFQVWPDSGLDRVLARIEWPPTGKDGTFRLGGLPQGKLNLYVKSDRHVPRAVKAESGRTDLRIVLTDAGTIEGRLVLPEGAGAPEDPTIQLEYSGDGSGPESRDWLVSEPEEARLTGLSFRLPGLHPGTYRVTARVIGLGCGQVGGIEVRAGETTRTEIRIDTGAVLAGRVVDAEGRGIVGALVVAIDNTELPVLDLLTESAAYWNRAAYARSGADGRYRIPGLVPGHYGVGAVAEGRCPAALGDVAVPRTGDVPDLVLEAGSKLTVEALDTDGTPLRGATIFLMLPGESGSLDGTTDGRGNCVFPALPAGTVGVQLCARRRNLGRGVEIQPGAPARVTLRFPAEEAWLTGRVTRDGEPVPGRSVQVEYRGPDDAGYDALAVTGGDGRYEIRGLLPAEASLRIGAGERRPWGPIPSRIVTIRRGRNDFDLEIPLGAVSVVVVEDGSGRPIRDSRVTVDGRPGCFTDESGRGRIEDLEEVPVELVVSHQTFAPARRTVTATREGTEVRFGLRPAVKLEIVCRDGNGAPAGEPDVTLVAEDGFDVANAARNWGFAEALSGRAEFHLAPGAYRLHVEVEGFAPIDRDIRVPAEGLTLTLEFQ